MQYIFKKSVLFYRNQNISKQTNKKKTKPKAMKQASMKKLVE